MDVIQSNPPPLPLTHPAPSAADSGADILIVSGEDAKQLLADIVTPPEPTEALRELMKCHRKPSR